MPIPFDVHPVRQVPPEPQDARWTVRVNRADAWPGWSWLDRVIDSNWVGEFAVIPLALTLLAVPSILARRLAYLIRRRSDWEVLVFEGWEGDYRPKRSLHRERFATKGEAVKAADVVYQRLLSGDTSLLVG